MSFRELVIEYVDNLDGHYELGREIGSNTREMIVDALPRDLDLKKLVNAVKTDKSLQTRLYYYQELLLRDYPLVMQELRGMADGACVEFDTVFISNYRKELSWDTKGCTDVHAHFADWEGWGHNEDYSWPPDYRPLTLLTVTSKNERGGNIRTWWSVVYPLCLGGMTVGMNSDGLVFSVNNLTPHWVIERESVSSQVICRLALDASSCDAFVAVVTDKRLATGRGFTFSSFDDKTIKYIETGPGGVHVINPKPEGHTNHYIYLDLDSKRSESTIHRMDTLGTLSSQIKKPMDILKVLSDISDTQYPIFRTGVLPDRGFTDFTALIDLTNSKISLYYERPWRGDGNFARPEKLIEFSSISG